MNNSQNSKKILVVVPSFHNGGTISSLKNILPILKEFEFVVDVFPLTNEGENYEYISQYANVIGRKVDNGADGSVKRVSVRDNLFRIFFLVVKGIKKQLVKIGIDISEVLFKHSVRRLQKNNYDVVVAFQEGQPTRYISLFKNVKKISWVRCDYGNMLKISNGKPQHKLYSKIDQVVCVSEYTKEVFTRLLPETKDAAIALHNLIDTERIRRGASEGFKLDERFLYEGFRIVSIGRIDPVKQFSLIPMIARQLVITGCVYKWYIIGGKAIENEYNLLVDNISQYGVADNVLLLGEISNPYPYIKQADLVVCTSLSEACPNVINEAKILHTPIVCTDFGSAREFITDGQDGFIAPIETIANKIELMIKDNYVYNLIANNISEFEYNNDEIVKTLKQLLCQ